MRQCSSDEPICDKCGVAVTTGLMAVFCPRYKDCEFYVPELESFINNWNWTPAFPNASPSARQRVSTEAGIRAAPSQRAGAGTERDDMSDNVIDLGKKAKRRIIIEDEWIYVENFHPPLTENGRALGLHTCRTVSHEAVAWGVRRLGEELEKSCSFYRTGEPTGKICVD